MYRFLISQRYERILFVIGRLEKLNVRSLSKEVNMTTGHLSNVTDQWEREGIINKKRVGRETNLILTEKGKKVITLLQDFDKIATKQIKKLGEKNGI